MALNIADFIIEIEPGTMVVSTVEDAEVHEGEASLVFDTHTSVTGAAALTIDDPLKRGYTSGRFRTTLEYHPLSGPHTSTAGLFAGLYLMRSVDPEVTHLTLNTPDFYTVGLALSAGVFTWEVRKYTSGLKSNTTTGMTVLDSAAAPGVAPDIKLWAEVLWRTDITGPKMTLNVGTEAAWANMTQILNFRDTSSPLMISHGEGPVFQSHTGTDRRVIMMDSTSINLYEPVVV